MEEKLESAPCKIAIVGPESTGKSLMTRRLAGEFGTWYVPEYSRYYCEDLNNEYSLQDEINIFHGQIALENCIVDMNENPLLFCDTTILTVKIWSDHLFGFTPDKVLEAIRNRKYGYYLLLDIDLPWVDDPLRDFPHQREHFMQVWESELQNLNARYWIVRGIGEGRYQKGIQAVREFLDEGH